MSCPSARGLRGFSPDIYYENVVEHLEVHLTILWGPPYNWIPLEFLPVKIVHIGLPAIHKLQCSFSYPGTGSYSSFCWASLLCKPWLPVFACLLLQFWGSWFTLCPLSPMNLSRVINFPVRSGFPCCEDGLATSKILTCGNRNWRLPKQLLTGRTRLKDFYCLFQDLPETYSNRDRVIMMKRQIAQWNGEPGNRLTHICSTEIWQKYQHRTRMKESLFSKGAGTT